MARNMGKDIVLKVAGTDYKLDCKKVRLDNEEAEVVTFGTAGARQWFFEIEAVEDTASGSLWSYLWSNAGSDVAFVFAPNGNAIEAADKPHFTGTLTLGPKPGVGGEAGSSFTFETRWNVIGEPVRDITP